MSSYIFLVVAVCSLAASAYIVFQLRKIHVLVNSRLSEALNRIGVLEHLLQQTGIIVPQDEHRIGN